MIRVFSLVDWQIDEYGDGRSWGIENDVLTIYGEDSKAIASHPWRHVAKVESDGKPVDVEEDKE